MVKIKSISAHEFTMIVNEPCLRGRFTPSLGQVVGVIDAVLVEAAANLQGCVASNVVEGKPSRRVVQEGHPAYIAEWLRRGEGACVRVDQVPKASREPAWIIGGRVRIASPGAGARMTSPGKRRWSLQPRYTVGDFKL